jgi:hypothetical protein
MIKVLEQRGGEWSNVFQPIGWRTNKHDRNLKPGQVLLDRDFAVDGYEHIEFLPS